LLALALGVENDAGNWWEAGEGGELGHTSL